MALFKNKKEEGKVRDAEVVSTKKDDKGDVKSDDKAKSTNVSFRKNLDGVLLRPRITEKSTVSVEQNRAYVFEISPRATKGDVIEAVKSIYKVTPIKVRVVNIPAKKVTRRGRIGMRSGGKKAYIFLNKKDKIEFV